MYEKNENSLHFFAYVSFDFDVLSDTEVDEKDESKFDS